MQLTSIVEHLTSAGIEAKVMGDKQIDIHQIASLHDADQQNISFLSDKKRLNDLRTTKAGAVLIKEAHHLETQVTKVLVEDPYYAYAVVARLLNPISKEPKGIHTQAVVAESAVLSKGVSVLANAVIDDKVEIGANTLIMQGVVIGRQVQIGQNCRIAPNVVIMQNCIIGDDVIIEAGSVIGGDGFGWANHQGCWVKVPQIGRVIIGNGVSIGNNCTVDRGALEDTVIEEGCIIDNLVHIAHNVKIGKHSAIAGQVGFAGSTSLGEKCTVAGQAGFAGHLNITNQVHILAKAGVTHDLNQSGVYAGFPVVDVADWQKNSVRARNLDKMAKQIKALEKKIELLEES